MDGVCKIGRQCIPCITCKLYWKILEHRSLFVGRFFSLPSQTKIHEKKRRRESLSTNLFCIPKKTSGVSFLNKIKWGTWTLSLLLRAKQQHKSREEGNRIKTLLFWESHGSPVYKFGWCSYVAKRREAERRGSCCAATFSLFLSQNFSKNKSEYIRVSPSDNMMTAVVMVNFEPFADITTFHGT